jgi:hypothetical protein
MSLRTGKLFEEQWLAVYTTYFNIRMVFKFSEQATVLPYVTLMCTCL